jgi:hypothetical protein
MQALDEWCFDEARQSGDSTVIQTELGCHLLYFCGSQEVGYTEAKAALLESKDAEQIAAAMEAYPMEVTYSAIGVAEADNTADITYTDVLYPDIAHERYPHSYLGVAYTFKELLHRKECHKWEYAPYEHVVVGECHLGHRLYILPWARHPTA